jgi:death on curing protein
VSGWRWITREVILAVHDELLAEHGGAAGLRDTGLLDSALARPMARAAYAEATVFDLAAAYAFGLARNHPFIDGNKRVAFLAAALFLADHGFDIAASEEETLLAMLSLAEGSIGETEFALWCENNAKPIA